MTIPPSTATGDLEACSREQIHIPGAIQPHGSILVVDPANRKCLQASANCAEFLGLKSEVSAGSALGDIAPELDAVLNEFLAQKASGTNRRRRVDMADRVLDISFIETGAGIIIECEAAGPSDMSFYQEGLLRALSYLRKAGSLAEQFEAMVTYIGELTGFERVMLYQFGADWHGQVVAEHLSAPVDSYLGLHFPASDIPAQARELYRKNWLRLIPNSSYTPVPVKPALNPRTQQPLDMSFVSLRSVSPIHLEYLRNMNVAASMSISVIVDGNLWGLIACHHSTPRVLPYAIRALCEVYGQVVSFEIGARQESALLNQFLQATTIQSSFFEIIAQEQNAIDALIKYTPQLLEFMDATGAAIYVNGRLELLGQETPGENDVKELVAWLQTQQLNPLLATHALSTLYAPAAKYREIASGLLAVKLSRVEPQYVLWFRPELPTVVQWAGDPSKPADDHHRISPRKSFSTWKQRVTGHSKPWTAMEEQGAQELVLAINALVLRRTQRLLSLNEELEKKNTDLNSFAYIASHDLKEPLRGIENYLTFLKEDHTRELSTEALRKITTIENLAGHCKELIDILNRYSELGRMEITPRTAHLDAVVDQVLMAVGPQLHEQNIEIRRPSALPSVVCDPVLIREVFSNLLVNAAKYNTSAEKWVEIGSSSENGEQHFFVRDNGIGIKPQHHADIFKMFRRLHAKDTFGGGTGAGLAIVQSIIERHGGRIWVESDFGAGTTFYFTLEAGKNGTMTT